MDTPPLLADSDWANSLQANTLQRFKKEAFSFKLEGTSGPGYPSGTVHPSAEAMFESSKKQKQLIKERNGPGIEAEPRYESKEQAKEVLQPLPEVVMQKEPPP